MQLGATAAIRLLLACMYVSAKIPHKKIKKRHQPTADNRWNQTRRQRNVYRQLDQMQASAIIEIFATANNKRDAFPFSGINLYIPTRLAPPTCPPPYPAAQEEEQAKHRFRRKRYVALEAT